MLGDTMFLIGLSSLHYYLYRLDTQFVTIYDLFLDI